MIKSYRDLEAWQKGMDLVQEIYRISKQFPKEELLGLTAQMRRAAVSVPANIAEGQGRLQTAEFTRFLSIARGSLTEVETYLLVSVRLEYIDRDAAKPAWLLTQEVGRLINALILSLRVNKHNGSHLAEISAPYEYDIESEADLDYPDLP
jgi:four helix bundle protein